ncbi:sugar transferase [Rhizobium lentis]|uniref:Lipopolysaccharide/colanic/teichoic acid biosynthesis glycosyltransferase n=1 Tax=Rhizobium lentis TaxID=1138194 RepID=A0A7W8XET6_9HYPH|nr:sugar transferase [Rhizobium lentis]MBB4574855.1 lipopolysaccharide/colanic/teichoic acid biosynthesis glycosyltransferase [Rhizobium lentis]MBB5550782.1 lipopolysaccharide/colanic/teichoic acid biosynthesis glycosyltransferase [Rhizobium lentis]MBB5561096.1 lipopolysaccharide/colanic/teichoic acid biosynthesis glycosyltransferase [Rhizobium lentis]MBB5567901.1 lipopolysaccharide/colanic/teichoic acid biosynthesis glycosyltransferase [Rhizobium lentis]
MSLLASISDLPKAITANDVAARTGPANSVPPMANATPGAAFSKGLRLNIPAPIRRKASRLATSSILVAGDIASYLIAYSLLLLFLPYGSENMLLERACALAALAAIILYASSALYPGYRIHDHEHLRRRTMASVKVAVIAALGAILLPEGTRLLLPLFGFLGLGLIVQPAMHGAARGLSRRLGVWGEQAVIIGGSNRIPALIAHFTDHWQYGIRPESCVPDISDLSPYDRPSIALIADDTGSHIAELATLRQTFAEVILLSDTPNVKVAGLRPAEIGGEIGVRLASSGGAANSNLVRRALDLAIAIPAVLVLMPIILIAAAAIYAIDPGPVFFRHAREGLFGKPVHVLKLRTMYRDAEQRLEALFRDNPAAQAEWSTHFKLREDPRVLPVIGHLLRASSIDELPQLVNIIAGEMALVGPRPFPEYHLSAMDSEFRDKRRSVVPGLTGLWQISERSDADIELQQQLDGFYIDNRSLWFDWYILLSTIPAVLKGKGAC